MLVYFLGKNTVLKFPRKEAAWHSWIKWWCFNCSTLITLILKIELFQNDFRKSLQKPYPNLLNRFKINCFDLNNILNGKIQCDLYILLLLKIANPTTVKKNNSFYFSYPSNSNSSIPLTLISIKSLLPLYGIR